MKILNRALLAATLLATLALSAPVLAQIGSTHIPGRGEGDKGAATNSSISFYPGTTFIASGNGINTAISGFLISGDTGAATRDGKYAGQLGAWYFNHGSNSDLYEFHLKGYINRTFGVQVGILGSGQTSVNPIDAFFLYNYESRGARRWSLQAGAGIFSDPLTDTGLSFFLQAATPIAKNLDLNAYYWYAHDVIDFHRLGLGVSVRF